MQDLRDTTGGVPVGIHLLWDFRQELREVLFRDVMGIVGKHTHICRNSGDDRFVLDVSRRSGVQYIPVGFHLSGNRWLVDQVIVAAAGGNSCQGRFVQDLSDTAGSIPVGVHLFWNVWQELRKVLFRDVMGIIGKRAYIGGFVQDLLHTAGGVPVGRQLGECAAAASGQWNNGGVGSVGIRDGNHKVGPKSVQGDGWRDTVVAVFSIFAVLAIFTIHTVGNGEGGGGGVRVPYSIYIHIGHVGAGLRPGNVHNAAAISAGAYVGEVGRVAQVVVVACEGHGGQTVVQVDIAGVGYVVDGILQGAHVVLQVVNGVLHGVDGGQVIDILSGDKAGIVGQLAEVGGDGGFVGQVVIIAAGGHGGQVRFVKNVGYAGGVGRVPVHLLLHECASVATTVRDGVLVGAVHVGDGEH